MITFTELLSNTNHVIAMTSRDAAISTRMRVKSKFHSKSNSNPLGASAAIWIELVEFFMPPRSILA